MFFTGDILLDRYEVISYSATGMSVVYILEDRSTGQLLFAKGPKKNVPLEAELRRRFREELAFSLELGDHPNVLPIRFIEEVDGELMQFSDYIPDEGEGNDLDKRIRRGLTFEDAIAFAHQITMGMEFLNSRGEVAHLDLKPSNILITKEHIAKISDFGLARRADPLYHKPRAENAGSLAYMAPEHFKGEAVDTRSDIYSFGIIFYEMLAGEYPFEADVRAMPDTEKLQFFKTLHAQSEWGKKLYWEGAPYIRQKLADKHLDLRPEQYRSLGQIIGACIDILPEKRYYSFTDVRKALEFAFPELRGQGVEAGKEKSDYQRGLAHQKMGAHGKALTAFNRALKADPRDARVWHAAAFSLWEMKNYRQALQFAQRAADMVPEESKFSQQLQAFKDQLESWNEGADNRPR